MVRVLRLPHTELQTVLGIEFWRPGSGIIHQVVLENYAAPGMLMYVNVSIKICLYGLITF